MCSVRLEWAEESGIVSSVLSHFILKNTLMHELIKTVVAVRYRIFTFLYLNFLCGVI